MQGGFSLSLFIVWTLILAAIFGCARMVPWRPLRLTLNGVGALLVIASILNIIWFFIGRIRS